MGNFWSIPVISPEESVQTNKNEMLWKMQDEHQARETATSRSAIQEIDGKNPAAHTSVQTDTSVSTKDKYCRKLHWNGNTLYQPNNLKSTFYFKLLSSFSLFITRVWNSNLGTPTLPQA